ncbi:YraN family protein [Anaplasmataceae bacterium AB001_6]|nr:YraN family protein [Anaplasmataceae bacterium AB001_6]
MNHCINNKHLCNTDGLLAEKFTINKLVKSGHIIKEHRYRSPLGEVDIIASKDSSFKFIEVKYRNNKSALSYSITEHKIARLYNSANFYIENFLVDLHKKDIDFRIEAWLISMLGYQIYPIILDKDIIYEI